MSGKQQQRKNGASPSQSNGHRRRRMPANPHQVAGEIRNSILNDIVETDLSEGSKNLLRNLLTQDFVLANLSTEEAEEIKWKLEAKKEKFFAMHPPENSLVTGEDRAAINDDPTDNLRPLGPVQRMQVHDVFDGIYLRVTRSKDMKQQEVMNTRIQERRDNNDGESSKGGLRGLIGS